MKIAVIGLWHLGNVIAACLADKNHDVLAFDSNREIIHLLQQGGSVIYEPGLNELQKQAAKNGKLHYTSDLNQLTESEIIWIAFDTPVDEHDVADVNFVSNEIKRVLLYTKQSALVIISSQVPVGTTRQLQQVCMEKWPKKNITFAYIPENLRLGKAIDVFKNPDRIVVGLQIEADKNRIQNLLKPFTQNIIWMSIESAEMTKHAINAFLATSIIFMNEISEICERVGANAREIEIGLKSESRIGPHAYIRPGAAIGGGTLQRDVNFLVQISKQKNLSTTFFSTLIHSNDFHKQWSFRRISDIMKNLANKKIAILGLTYKAGTNTLRRSTVIETCAQLNAQGAKITAYDPMISQLPDPLADFIELKSSIEQALQNADAVIVSTEWPEFMSLTVDQLLATVKQPLVFDADGFLTRTLGQDNRVRYFSVGVGLWN